MWFRTLFDSPRSRGSRTPPRRLEPSPARRRPGALPLRVETLEDRSLPSSYAVTDLGPLPGGYYCTPSDINAAGQVVGQSDSPQNTRAVLWNNGTVIDLGTLRLTGYNGRSRATGINDRGQIVGSSSVAASSVYPYLETHAFLLTPEDTDGNGAPDRWFRDLNADGANDLMTDLGVPAGGTYSAGFGINNAGQVLVATYNYDVVPNNKTFLWDRGAFTELGMFAGPGYAGGINDAGQVVGATRDAAGDTRVVLWDGSRGTTGLGDATGYTHVGANAISPSGSVVGSGFDSAAVAGTFAWTPDQPNGTTGTTNALPPLPGDSYGMAYDINDAGQVVGSSTYEETSYYEYWDWDSFYSGYTTYTLDHATVWQNGVPTDLNTRLLEHPGTDLNLLTAGYINAAGQIAGVADSAGRQHGFLLTPVAGPAVAIVGDTVVEGNAGTVDAVFTVTLSEPSAGPVTVAYAAEDGTAVAGGDYRAVGGTLTFAPGETTKTIAVPVNGDRLGEPNEKFVIRLSNPTNAAIANSWGLGTIVDDEPRVRIGGGGAVLEGNSGTTNAVFTVTLSAASDAPVTVTYATADYTATAGGDYQARSGTLTFAPGETSKTVTVPVNGDRLGESKEYFAVNLSGATNAYLTAAINGYLGDAQGWASIVDDEPRISISDVTKAEGKKGQTTLFTFTVTLSAAYDEAVTMSFRTADWTAKANQSDYVAKAGTLTFAPGETTKTVTIEVKGDSKREADESFCLDLFGNRSNSLFTNNRGVGTIWNDD
jgi:probable HAF family extracellular repeat protein